MVRIHVADCWRYDGFRGVQGVTSYKRCIQRTLKGISPVPMFDKFRSFVGCWVIFRLWRVRRGSLMPRFAPAPFFRAHNGHIPKMSEIYCELTNISQSAALL